MKSGNPFYSIIYWHIATILFINNSICLTNRAVQGSHKQLTNFRNKFKGKKCKYVTGI